jgi:hypothetical protein
MAKKTLGREQDDVWEEGNTDKGPFFGVHSKGMLGQQIKMSE